ncbi:diguanylate cyclase [Couchioplanes caeruleus]|uniref:diguanylate cyclase domain-containing protein n=1 Tax=Couchioplanes caeruleus TaxID=56438 RepID=UPI0020BF59AC|nr:diguanylate cyclase [Couchioplanes caeruleus]UQU62804.1 diguanylate cyclase [Couchioplanes caeruleus]
MVQRSLRTGYAHVRSFVQRDPMRSLRLFFLTSLALCATGLTVQTRHAGLGADVTTLCAAVQLFGFALRIVEFRRARPLPIWVDALELAAVLALLSQVTDVSPVISTFFMAVLFRAAIGGLPRLLLSQAGYLGVWAIAIAMPWHVEPVPGAMISLPTTSLMVYGTRALMAKLQEQQKDRNALLGGVLTELPFPVVVTDDAGEVVLANPAVTDLVGWSGAEAPGLHRLRLQDLEGRPVDLRELAAGGARTRIEVRLVRPDGVTLQLVVQTVPMTASLSQGAGVVLALLDVTSQRAYEEHLHRAAYYDMLTGLPNRRLLFERLGLAHSTGTGYAMLLIDLNDFKAVNDTHGHKVGDELLTAVAQRIDAAAGDTATVARLGGDEFAVLLPHAGATGAEVVARAVRDSFAAPLQLSCGPLQSGGTVGVAIAGPGQTPDEVIERADHAMYLAKSVARRRHRAPLGPRNDVPADRSDEGCHRPATISAPDS